MNINNKEYPVKFGMNQSILYCELRGINITQMNTEFSNMAKGKSTGAELRDLIWSALKDGARFNKVPFEATNLDVGDWLEGLDPKEVTAFIEDMVGTLPKAKAMVKKKVTRKLSQQ